MTVKKVALGALAIASAIVVGVVAGIAVARLSDGGDDRVTATGGTASTSEHQEAASTTDDNRAEDDDEPESAPTTRNGGTGNQPAVAAPTTSLVTPAPPATEVRSVDWEALTYVVEEQDTDIEITPTTDESAEMGWAMSGQEFGDLDGDGHEDALVKLYDIGPSVRPAAAFVILASDPQPKGLATRRVQYPVFPSGNIQEVRIEGRQLRMQAEDHGLGGSHGSPPNDVEATYELRNGEVVELSRTSTPKSDSIEGRFNAMVDAYLARDLPGVEALLGGYVDRLGDPGSWQTDLDDPSCREGNDPTQVVCALHPEGGVQVMITIDRFDGEVTDVFVGGGM